MIARAETFRLFFALWPDPELRARIARLAQPLIVRNGKPTPPENFHITLAFLGNVDEQAKACVEVLGDQIRQPAFTLALDRIGYFPRPRIAWLGCTQVPAQVVALAGDLSRGLLACGLEPEQRPYRPHLTLARKAGPIESGSFEALEWNVDRFSLVRSQTLSEGVEYRVLNTWNLSDPNNPGQ